MQKINNRNIYNFCNNFNFDKMDKNKVFLVSFLATLTLLTYFLGSSITGQVTKTSYCDVTGCYELCISDTDCMDNNVCCAARNFGICKESCTEKFVFHPETDYPVPFIEAPTQVNTLLYGFLILLTLFIGAVYLLHNKIIHIKK